MNRAREENGARAAVAWRNAARAAVLGATLAIGLAGGGAAPAALGSVPTGTPTFAAPLTFTNRYFPFAPGGVKVFHGRSDGVRTTVVDVYTATTRDFTFGPATVSCRMLQETEFEGTDLVEISYNYFAQADDGTVYYFGEVVDEYEDGEVTGHDGSWLLGGPAGNDPEETQTVTVPAVFMPANPQPGDVFRPEDVPDGPQERDTVVRRGRRVRVPAGRFAGCLEVREKSGNDPRETKWYAPGVGVIAAQGRGEHLRLEATTLGQ